MSIENVNSEALDDMRAPDHQGDLGLSLSFGLDDVAESEPVTPSSPQDSALTAPTPSAPMTAGSAVAAGAASPSPAPDVAGPAPTPDVPAPPPGLQIDFGGDPGVPPKPSPSASSLPAAPPPSGTRQATISQTPAAAGEDHRVVYQVPYRPGSSKPSTGALVPSSLSEAVHEAIAEFIRKHGPIDDYVCEALQIDHDRLEEILTAEQIDAVALAISGLLSGAEIIVADVTGYGKGRTLAAVGKAMLLQGRNIIFLTEKANLFSDFWRDVCDIGAEDVFGPQIIVNFGNNGRIVHMRERDSDGNPIILHKHSPKLLKELLAQENPEWPDGYSCIMATYSQLNRANSDKSKLLTALARNSIVISDEAHNAVKNSNIGTNVREIKKAARAVINSSATYARGVEEMATYSDAMPWLNILSGICGFSLGRLSRPARAALGEASATRAARIGRLIRREHDMSNMVMRATDVRDLVGVAVVDETEDRFSTIVNRLARIWRASKGICAALPPEPYGNAAPSNFGSTFAALNGQFSLSVLLDAARREAIRITLEGKKYLGVIDSTQESMLALIRDIRADPELMPGIEIAAMPDIRDLIMVAAYRLRRISYKVQKVEQHIFADSPEIQTLIGELKEMLRDFPPLPISPLDYLARAIEEEGQRLYETGRITRPWRVGEISGRTLSLASDGSVVPFVGTPRDSVIYGFNHGGDSYIDQLLLTRAGSVGLSAHDATTNREPGVRHMQEIWPTPNVVERVQMWGRIGRRGSRSEPEYSMLCSSAPGDIYAIVSQGRKIAEVSAVVSGSSETLRMLQEMEDPIDHAGEVAATNFLADHPLYRRDLMIGVDDEEAEESDDGVFQGDGREYGTILGVLRRLRLLPYARQRQVFDSLIERREEVLTAFPREPSILEGVWTETSSRLLDQPQGDGPPLRLVEIESQRARPPIDSTRLRAILHSLRPQQTPAPAMRQALENKARELLRQTALQNRFESAGAALRSPMPNVVKAMKGQFDAMLRVIDMQPGMPVVVPGEGGRPVYSILVGITLRDPTAPCNARAYRVFYVAPGDEDVRHVTLERMIRSPERYGPVRLDGDISALAAQFDQAVQRETKVRRIIISGDPIDEVLGSIRLGGGTRATFQLQREGKVSWSHGIVVPRHLHQEAPGISVRIASGEMAWDALRSGYDLTTRITDEETSGGLRIQYHDCFADKLATLSALSERSLWLIPTLARLARMETRNNGTIIRFPNEEVAIAGIGTMITAGVPFFAPAAYRDGPRHDPARDTPRRVPNRPALIAPSP